jgi:hypothetical protein
MERSQKYKLEMFEREEVFLKDNLADFPPNSPGGKALAELSAVIIMIRRLAAEQISGASGSRQHISVKDDEIDDLVRLIRKINRAANAFEEDMPGSDLKFRLPRNRSDQNLLATARAFLADAAPLEAKFIEYGLPADFLAKLQSLIDAVDERASAADSSVEQQAGATGGLLEAVRKGMSISRRLDSIVRNKYDDNPVKLGAWTTASHLQSAPEKPKPAQPPN